MERSRRPDPGFQLERVVDLGRKHLDFDVVLALEATAGRPICRAVAGDRSALGIARDGRWPFPIPRLSVPLRFSDGDLYGWLSAVDNASERTRDLAPDVSFMSLLADLVIDDLDAYRERERLRDGLIELLETEQVMVAYQPIYDLTSNRCLGVEALARFSEPFSRPDVTFHAAQQLGLGVQLEELVVRRAWDVIDLLGENQFLALNLTPCALLELARRARRRMDVDLSSVVVEITEHEAIDAYAALRDELAELRSRGLRVAVDDIGAGYASLRHVLELGPDIVKVDRYLIDGISRDGARRAAVGSFVALAHGLGSMIVAEGIESEEDLRAVRELHIDAAQGYLLGRPSTDPAALRAWVGQDSSGSALGWRAASATGVSLAASVMSRLPRPRVK
jgi:EAL domain-containing protein (putative c-di-GMP-specific phosphodiesterase class I)